MRGERNAVLDFVKGSLVLLMVFYHWLNYFIGLDWNGYRYLRFLTPSFILITGFLVSHVYLARYTLGSRRLRDRLVQRGAKLLLLFAILNVLSAMMFGAHQNGIGSSSTSWLAKANAIFVIGDGTAAFNVLVSIGYFLLLVPIVLVLSKETGISLSVMAAFALAGTINAGLLGYSNAHLELLSVGLVGLAAGSVEFRRIEAALQKPALLLFSYLLYVVAITVWGDPFPLQVVGVSLSVALIYVVGLRCGTRGVIQQCVVDLGKYSLFSYIAQIAILQLLRRGLHTAHLSGAEPFVALAVGVIGTVIAAQLLVSARVNSTIADRLYRAVLA